MGFEPVFPASERPQTNSLCRDAVKHIYVIKRISCTQYIWGSQFISFLILFVLYLLLFHLNPVSCALLCRTYCLHEKQNISLFYCTKKLVQAWNYFLFNTKVFDSTTNYSYIKTVDQKCLRASFHYLSRDTSQHLTIFFFLLFSSSAYRFQIIFHVERSLLIQGCQRCHPTHGLPTLQKFSGLLMM